MAAIESPCILVCSMDVKTGYCFGCGRTRDEIAAWIEMTPQMRRAVMELLPARLETVERGRAAKPAARAWRANATARPDPPMSRAFWIAVAILGGGLILLVANDSSGQVLGIDTGDFGRLVYLGALGAVVATGILASGRRFGDTARNLALWMLVILVFMAGYEYRYELQDVANRVSGGLIPGSPLSVVDGDGRATVTLRKRPDGHFEAGVSINGKTIDAVVDTGATATVLTAADAARAGFDPATLRYTIPVSTANGTANAARVVADEIAVGGITRKNMPLLVAEPGRLDQSLLGMNFIGSLSGFDVRGDRLILRD